MNRKLAKKLWPILKAYAEGRKIQCKAFGNGAWVDETHISKTGFSEYFEYRVKPEPREWIVYRGNTALYFDDSGSSFEKIKVREVIE